MKRMSDIPEHFERRDLDIFIEEGHRLGRVYGVLFHYPSWFGVFHPSEYYLSSRIRLMDRLDKQNIEILVIDPINNQRWSGSMLYISEPDSDYPWYEVKWHDSKTL